MSKKNFKVNNGLSGALDLPSAPQIAPKLLYKNASPVFLTQHWTWLTYFYMHNGFMQSAVNCVIDDAFRNDGLIIDTKTLNTEELEKLKETMRENNDIEVIKDCLRWSSLYGGACMIADTEQDYKTPLDEEKLKGKNLSFICADRWHCVPVGAYPQEAKQFLFTNNLDKQNKVGSAAVDASRILPYSGVPTPYFAKQVLQGWGQSIFESILPPLLQYLESLDVTLELLSEAKIDIVKINDLAATLLSQNGEQKIRKRLEVMTKNKNYKSSIALDALDDYIQKQINFGGLPQMIEQIQYLVCSALKRPYSKVFGKGSSGLSEQTIDIENYNSVVDAEIRTPATQLIKWVVDLRCMQLFGRKLPDFQPKWKALRTLSEKEQSEVNSKLIQDYIALLQAGVMSPRQVAQKLTENGTVLFSDEEIEKLDDEIQQFNQPNNFDEFMNQ